MTSRSGPAVPRHCRTRLWTIRRCPGFKPLPGWAARNSNNALASNSGASASMALALIQTSANGSARVRQSWGFCSCSGDAWHCRYFRAVLRSPPALRAFSFILWVRANSLRSRPHCFSVITLRQATRPTGTRPPSGFAGRTKKPSPQVGNFNRRHREK